MEVSGLFIYPIKSLGGIRLESSEVGLKGLKYDRRYVLVDTEGVFVSQRTVPKMCLFDVKLARVGFEVLNIETQDRITIPLELTTGEKLKVKIWDDEVDCLLADEVINEWFSLQVGIDVQLCYQPENEIRKVDSKYGKSETDQTSLSDGYPVLMLSEESLEAINMRCPESIDMMRFRPNIVVKGIKAFEEDRIGEFEIGNVQMVGVKKCARCQVVNIDHKTAQKGLEPLKTLSEFRKVDSKIMVGINVIVSTIGKIVLSDKINRRYI